MATASPTYNPAVTTVAIASVGNGLTLSAAGALSNDLITGKAGGQTVVGGTAASENLTLSSTSNVTKGKVVVSDNLVIAAGTSSNAAIQHASNAGTGLYGVSATQIGFVANSTVAGSWSNTFFNLQVSLQAQGGIAMSDTNITTGTSTGTKIGTATNQKFGFFNATPVVQQARGATLTNNVTSGGTDDTIANFTDLTTYANDAAAIRNDIYQLARALRLHDVALRALGLES